MNIPAQHMEIEEIYHQTLARGIRSLAITAANPEEGVSTLAIALAQRSLLAGKSTLLVDLNLYRPTLKSLAMVENSLTSKACHQPQLVGSSGRSLALTGVVAPARREDILQLRRPEELSRQIQQWQRDFDTLIFDTSPFSRINANNIPAEQVATACDGCLLVILAGQTTESMAQAAVEKLRSSDANLLGCVLNDRFNPPLQQELLREVNRLPRFARRLAQALRQWIRQNPLLSLEV
ncbi:protein SypD [Bacterioplanes sanyensis]|uniref:Protein SypD n=1 Tax=Bacterioplanes sanyensis TaxID=1249553 RepID=A0A222FN70_9GAMM|nr:protein SypD [Bacterioplanes sanyensis]ASP39663.1 protein SypD [Bacterioplanes sanyensis]